MQTHEAYQAPTKSPSTMYELPQKYQDFLNSSYSGDAAFFQDNINFHKYNLQMNNTHASNTSNTSVNSNNSSMFNMSQMSQMTTNHNMKRKTESVHSLTKTLGELSPVFQSEAARQIIIEMSSPGDESEGNSKARRRAVPKEKRRHNTAPHHVNAKSMQTIQSENDMNKSVRNILLV